MTADGWHVIALMVKRDWTNENLCGWGGLICDVKKELYEVYRTTDVSDVQRLGYLYEVVLGDREQGTVVYDELKKLSPTLRNVLLVPGGNKECVRRDSRWHIDVNDKIFANPL